MEAPATEIIPCADRLTVFLRAERVSAVLDHGDSGDASQRVDANHFAGIAAEMYRHDSLRMEYLKTVRDRIDREISGHAVHVAKHRDQALVKEHGVSRDERDRRRKNLRPSRQIEGFHGEMKRCGA